MIVNCMFKPKRQIAISRNPNRPSRTLSETEIGQDVQVASLMKDENQRKGTCLEKLTYWSYLVLTDASYPLKSS